MVQKEGCYGDHGNQFRVARSGRKDSAFLTGIESEPRNRAGRKCTINDHLPLSCCRKVTLHPTVLYAQQSSIKNSLGILTSGIDA